VTAFGKDALAVGATLSVYQARVVPLARRELGRWREVAAAIPDPALRRHALSALTAKAANAEAIAVLGTLAPRPARATAIRAMTALQVAIDYLDNLGEDPGADPLGDGLSLHRALSVAVTPGAEPADWYAHHPQGEDGGYLDRLVAACQTELRSLPAPQILPHAARAAARCGEAQSQTHAAAGTGSAALEAWASCQGAPPVYEWWEVAAGASSSVAAAALIAAAADPRSAPAEAEAIDAAYFPSIGALTVLLDDLVDHEEDQAGGEHNYIDYYADAAAAADRLDLIAGLARGATARLRHPHRHAAILTGVVAFYLASPAAETGIAAPAKARLLGSAGPATRLLAAFLRLRQRD
jgi:tetraprenyl-beta-curcumene synthase